MSYIAKHHNGGHHEKSRYKNVVAVRTPEALGLAYLAFLWPTATYIATTIVFTFGAFGVVLALRRGLDIACPCMGSVLTVTLSTVTLTEDVAMVAMAMMLLIRV